MTPMTTIFGTLKQAPQRVTIDKEKGLEATALLLVETRHHYSHDQVRNKQVHHRITAWKELGLEAMNLQAGQRLICQVRIDSSQYKGKHVTKLTLVTFEVV